MSKALICVMNSHAREFKSYILKLFGNPDHYAHKLGNDTFADKLPIHMNWLRFTVYGYLHSVSIDYGSQKVYFSNTFHGRLEHGRFIYTNQTWGYFLDFLPETDQVNTYHLSKYLRIHFCQNLYCVAYTVSYVKSAKMRA